MFSGGLACQENLGSHLCGRLGLKYAEDRKVEVACGSGSGGAALHVGRNFIAAGSHDLVVVLGVEKMTDALPSTNSTNLALAAGYDTEIVHGAAFSTLNAHLKHHYINTYKCDPEDFALFSINAHKNAVTNDCALLRHAIDLDCYRTSSVVSATNRLMDISPVCDGAAAVILACDDITTVGSNKKNVRYLSSAGATDCNLLSARKNMLVLEAVTTSTTRAMEMAGITHNEIDFFELHDAFSIIAALSLEAAGFASPGEGVRLARNGDIRLEGNLPIATMGGLKGRGHPVGATGVYQAVETCLQLRQEAGQNQVKNARIGVTQNIGGIGSAVFTSVFAI
jgi:acetyl-CoA C-acetyltransferase